MVKKKYINNKKIGDIGKEQINLLCIRALGTLQDDKYILPKEHKLSNNKYFNAIIKQLENTPLNICTSFL